MTTKNTDKKRARLLQNYLTDKGYDCSYNGLLNAIRQGKTDEEIIAFAENKTIVLDPGNPKKNSIRRD